jgi:ketosteroid isomerase-like protein
MTLDPMALYGRWLAACERSELRALLDGRWFGTDPAGRVFGVDQCDRLQHPRRLVEAVAHPYQGGAVVRGTLAAQGQPSVRFVSLWLEADGEWRCLTQHETAVQESLFHVRGPTAPEATFAVEPEPCPEAEELARAYDELHIAMPRQNYSYLDAVLAEEWFTTDPIGEVRTKPQYMEFVREFMAPTVSFALSELAVRVAADLAATTCRYTLSGRMANGFEPQQAVRVTGVWRRSPREWTYLAQQGSFIE